MDKFNLKDFKTLIMSTNDEKWWQGTGCQYPLVVPKGTKVEFIGVCKNYYGTWFRVKYENSSYYIAPDLLEGNVMISKEVFSQFDVASLKTFIKIIYTDRFGQKYLQINGEGDLELI